jgi:hypothetical protein
MTESGNDRKERVIHTRVAEDLDEEVKRRAQNLGVSVSNLVRNILQNTIGLVEDIIEGGSENTRASRWADDDEPLAARPAKEPRVLGWQHATLAVNALCEKCNAILPRGTRAGIAVLDTPGAPSFRCERCIEEIQNDDQPRPPSE